MVTLKEYMLAWLAFWTPNYTLSVSSFDTNQLCRSTAQFLECVEMIIYEEIIQRSIFINLIHWLTCRPKSTGQNGRLILSHAFTFNISSPCL